MRTSKGYDCQSWEADSPGSEAVWVGEREVCAWFYLGKYPLWQTEKIISIEGIMCQHCVRHATEALEKIDGVSDVKVSLENKNAVIHVNQNVTDEQITNAIVAAGYEIISIK